MNIDQPIIEELINYYCKEIEYSHNIAYEENLSIIFRQIKSTLFVEKIDNIEVTINIIINMLSIHLIISSSNLLEENPYNEGEIYNLRYFEKKYPYTNDSEIQLKEELRLFINDISIILKNAKFDKKFGFFKLEQLDQHQHQEQYFSHSDQGFMKKLHIGLLWSKILAKDKNENFEINEQICCVCRDETLVKVPCCKANLCFVCWEKLVYKTCPICRGNINIVKKNIYLQKFELKK